MNDELEATTPMDEPAAGEPAETPPEPPQEPPSPTPADDPAPDPPASNLAARPPRNTNGHYVILVAKVTESQPLRFRELGYTKARTPEIAKQIVADDPLHGPKLRRDAEDNGIVLRAIPAMYWPKTDTTRVEVTKQLVLR